MKRRPVRVAAATLITAVVATGCGFTGPNSVQLPFSKGGGDDAIVITVEMESAANLVPNSEVKVGDVTVGSVRRIEFDDWRAELTVGLEPGTGLPANAVAQIGQKSLLGAEYLEIAAPVRQPSKELLAHGDIIPVSRTGRFPETEEVLAALSTVLNGGGLSQLRTITDELNGAFNGKAANWRSLIHQLNRFVSGMNAQRTDLVRLLTNINRLGGSLAEQRKVLEQALDTLPNGLGVLEEERPELVAALESVGNFGVALTQLIDRSQDDLVGNLRDLNPVLHEVADAGKHLPRSLGMTTFPFPVERLSEVVRGDYANLILNVDVSVDRLKNSLLAGTPLEGLLIGLTGSGPGRAGSDNGNPLLEPLDLPGLDDLLAGLTGSPDGPLAGLLGLLDRPEGGR